MKLIKYPDSRDLNDLSGPVLKQVVPIMIKLVKFQINQMGQLQDYIGPNDRLHPWEVE